MQEARRVYIYLMTFIALQIWLAGAANLVRLLLEQVLGASGSPGLGDNYLREQYSSSAAALVVGATVWAVHWQLAQRGVHLTTPRAAEERGSRLRGFMIYLVLLISVGQACFSLVESISSSRSSADSQANIAPADAAARLLIYGLVGLYYWRVRNLDQAPSPEESVTSDSHALYLYLYLMTIIALQISLAGAANLARVIIERALSTAASDGLGDNYLREQLGSYAAALVVGASVWAIHWRLAQRGVRLTNSRAAQERQSELRGGMIYLTLLITAWQASFALVLVTSILSSPSLAGSHANIARVSAAATLLIYAVAGLYYWRVRNQDLAAPPGGSLTSESHALYLYLYAMTIIALQIWLASATQLLHLLFEQMLGGAAPTGLSDTSLREQLSSYASVALVGAAIWATHWRLAQHGVRTDRRQSAEAIQSDWRGIMIYMILPISAWQVFFSLGRLVASILSGASFADSQANITRADLLATLLIYGLAGLYYWRVHNLDVAAAPEGFVSSVFRRLYFYLVDFVSLAVLLWALTGLADDLWRTLTASAPLFVSGSGMTETTANNAGWVVAGLLLWLLHWLPMQRLVAIAPSEQRSTLRKLCLYGIVAGTVAVTLTSLALFLNNLLRFLIGTNPVANSGDSLLTAAGLPLLMALIYGVFWAYHRQVLKGDELLVADEPPEQASIRRLYYHLVALISLVVLAGGAADLLRLLVDFALGGNLTTISRQELGDQISSAATLVLVGLPVWYLNWGQLQRRALAAHGADDRRSLLRRIYLYLVIFFTMIALLGGAIWIIDRVFFILGDVITKDWISGVSAAVGISITAAVLLGYHLRMMLSDQRAAAEMRAPAAGTSAQQAEPEMPTILLVLGYRTREVDRAALQAQRSLLAGGHLEVFPVPGLTITELTALLAARRPPLGAQGPEPELAGPP